MIILFFLSFTLFTAFASIGAGWLDAPEFIISAFFLDIPHPTGAPLYVQLSNAFALLPIGPVAFRVNLFSSACAALVLALCYLITLELQPKSSKYRQWLALIPALVLIHIPSFVKAALSAEVYLLHAVFILILLRLWQKYLLSKDARLLILMAFVCALSLANHVSGVFIFAPIFIVIALSHFRALIAILIPALLVAALGLGAYAYLPARAGNSLSLNTGNPNSLERLEAHLTNKRDRELRENQMTENQGELFANIAKADVLKLSQELNIAIVILGALGLCFLAARSCLFTLALAACAAGNWLFFQGWAPDPWIVLFCCLAIGAGGLAIRLQAWAHRSALIAPLVLLLTLQFLSPQLSLALFLRDDEMSSQVAKEKLQLIDSNSPYVPESCWFLAKYIRDVEGFRNDVPLIYGPSLFAPDYFPAPKLYLAKDKSLDLNSVSNGATELLNQVSPLSVIFMEPHMGLNQFISAIAQPIGLGVVKIVRGQNAAITEQDVARIRAEALRRKTLLGLSPSRVRNDGTFQLQVEASLISILLRSIGQPQAAVTLLSALCEPIKDTSCGDVLLNTYALNLIDAGEAARAKELLLAVIARGTNYREAIETNLKFAESKLNPPLN